jgi:putative CRISPR-associated protein (TIGR02619 family)
VSKNANKSKFNKVIITGGASVFNRNNYLAEKVRDIIVLNNSLKNGRVTLEEAKRSCKDRQFPVDERYSKRISAEFSVINALKKAGHLSEQFDVTILHTDTKDGCFAAEINKKIIEQQFNTNVKLVKVENLDVSNSRKLRENLGDFMEKLSRELVQSYKEYTFFAPVGGYKLMTYLGYVVGSFYGYETGYLYEENQVLIKIPPMPLKIDIDWILKKRDLLTKLLKDEIVYYSDLAEEDKIFINENSFFFEKVSDENDQLVSLNAYGKFILKDYLLTRKLVSKHLIHMFDNAKYRNHIQSNLLNLISKVKSFYRDGNKGKNIIGEIMHNKEWGFDKPYLYKGDSNGELIFRCLWDYDFSNDVIKIFEIWTNHGDYERECKAIANKGYNNPEEMIEIG